MEPKTAKTNNTTDRNYLKTMCKNLRLYVKDNFVDTKIISLYLKHLNK